MKLNNFQENISTTFQQLCGDTDFSYVTLEDEDGQKVEAHRVILSASSTVFLTMLKRNKNSHPLIYMRGLKSQYLQALMDFIYQGEANVYQNDLDKFLLLAEDLQVKGLSEIGSKELILGTLIRDDPNKTNQNVYENKQVMGNQNKILLVVQKKKL